MARHLRVSEGEPGSAVFRAVLIALLGVGILFIVRSEPGSAAETEEGQRALAAAEAGVQAAQKQLRTDSAPRSYDGGTDDSRWSSSRSGTTLTDLDRDPSTPDSANVRIEYRSADASFVAVSTGAYGDARRKVEAVFRPTDGVRIPQAYFTQSNLSISGAFSAQGASFFARGNVDVGTPSASFGTANDAMGRWAETSDAASYPNAYNATARQTALAGVGAQGRITVSSSSAAAAVSLGRRSYDATTTPRVVPDYHASTLQPGLKISFPFDAAPRPQDIETLRRKAQEQEASNPAPNNYKDNLPSGTVIIPDWPAGSDYDTVFFYRFPAWDPANVVRWDVQLPCGDTSRKGVIVVENGNFLMPGNRGGFAGTVAVEGGQDPATGRSYPDRGQLSATGAACMNGYAYSTGGMSLAGNFRAAGVPALGSLPALAGDMELTDKRELYVAADDAAATDEDFPLNIDVLANDHNPQGSTLPQRIGRPAHGSATWTSDGEISYAPDADFNGTDTFSYTVDDGGVESTATVTVEVAPVNDAPGFVRGPDQLVDEDHGVQEVPLWATGISAGPGNEAGQGLAFRVTNDDAELFEADGQPAVTPDGTLTYRPAENASGTASVSARLVDDGGTERGGSDASPTRTFTVTVAPVNDAPVADDDSAGTEKDVPVEIDALSDDRDAEGDALVLAEVSAPSHGRVAVAENGTLRYAPDPAYVGTDTFTYRASDGSARSEPATVTVTVADTIPPSTALVSGPSGAVRTASASFAFSSSEPGSKFECSLDGAAFAPCASPKGYADLADGRHAFRVRARDAALNADPSPQGRTWRVDTVRPAGGVVINSGAATTRTRTVKLDLRATDRAPASGVVSMRFRNAGTADWSAWQPYATSASWTLKGWIGTKTVYVQYRDEAGNVSAAAQDSISHLP